MKSCKIACYNKEFITSYFITTASLPCERQHPHLCNVSRKLPSYWRNNTK